MGIQVDAQKKYILISLIARGKIIPLPDFVSHRLSKTHTKCCRQYYELEEAFASTAAGLGKVVEKHFETYEKDYNMGLVHQVINAHEIGRVRKLRNVYASCSVQVAAQQADIEDPERAKKIILYLIKQGELSATIDAQDIVTFKRANQRETQQRYMQYS